MTASTRVGTRSGLTGLRRLIALALRTGWIGIAGVIALSAALAFAVTGSIEALFPTAGERLQYAETLGTSPASMAFNGRGYGLETVGGIAVYEIGFIGQLLLPLLALHIAVRHTRREEESGRTELITAARVGRMAPLAAGAVVVLVVSVASGILTAIGMSVMGADTAGSVWYAAGNTMLMAFFGGLGLFLSQLAQSARTAYLTGLGLVTAMYLLRAMVDGLGWDAVWLSPLGWLAQVRAFADPQLWPLVAFGVGTIVFVAAAAVVLQRRDLGAGVIRPKPGPARAGRGLATSAGLAWRLNRPPVVSWTILGVVWAGVFGLMTREMTQLIEANPAMLEALGVERGEDVVTSLAVVVVCLAATSVCVQGMGRLSSEESSDRLGALLATRVPRARLWLVWWTVVTLASLVVLALGSLTLGLATWVATSDSSAVGRAMMVSVGYAVPVVFIAALAAALRAVSSRWAPAAWFLVGWVAVVGFLDETLRLPDWARNLSPLHLVGTLPQQDPDVLAIIGLGIGAVVLVLGSFLVFTRRDLRPN